MAIIENNNCVYLLFNKYFIGINIVLILDNYYLDLSQNLHKLIY